MVEHYSHKIQNVIQKELFKAQKSIKIAVAWFTNDLLFQPLLLKLQAGVSVELILNKDEINHSENNEIDFNAFVENGGILHWNESKKLMHEKFCIIDDSVVIYGSYNWTNKAEYNNESIAVSKNEVATCEFYVNLFKKLSQAYPTAPYKPTNKANEESNNQFNAQGAGKSCCQSVSDDEKKKFETQRDIAITFFHDSLRSSHIPEGFKELVSIAEQGDPISALWVGACYKYGIFVEKNIDLSIKYYNISANAENKEAMLEMALFNSGVMLSSQNIEECQRYLKEASELKHPLAQWLSPRLKSEAMY